MWWAARAVFSEMSSNSSGGFAEQGGVGRSALPGCRDCSHVVWAAKSTIGCDDCLSPCRFDDAEKCADGFLATILCEQCLFVVWLGVERSMKHWDGVFQRFKTVFGDVKGVVEGLLEFPLSDLWRMGDHYMIEWMQHTLAVNLENYIYLLPRKGAEISRFDKETMQVRAEDRAMGGMQLTMDTGELSKVKPYAVKCPCPPYHENKMLNDVGLELQHYHRRMRFAAVCFAEAAAMTGKDLQTWLWLANAHLSNEAFVEAAAG